MIKKQYYNFKIVIIGSQSVGKSSIFARIVDKDLSKQYIPSLGFLLKTKLFLQRIRMLSIQDTSGQKKKHFSNNYAQSADGILLVYNITDDKSFKDLRLWLNQIKHKGIRDGPIIVFANKSDLVNYRVNQVPQTQMIELIQQQQRYQIYKMKFKKSKFLLVLEQILIDDQCNIQQSKYPQCKKD
ncbi:hypothetical protein pb186bvf_006690 [Paramecium bursaria]